jgi:hypothetical protein
VGGEPTSPSRPGPPRHDGVHPTRSCLLLPAHGTAAVVGPAPGSVPHVVALAPRSTRDLHKIFLTGTSEPVRVPAVPSLAHGTPAVDERKRREKAPYPPVGPMTFDRHPPADFCTKPNSGRGSAPVEDWRVGVSGSPKQANANPARTHHDATIRLRFVYPGTG